MRTREVMASAKRLGTDAGKSAAGWVFDGNTSAEAYRRVLKGIREGDPEVLDSFNYPNLSGEWADSPTPSSLAEDIGIDPEDERMDDACSVWESASADAFIAEVERVCIFHCQPESASK